MATTTTAAQPISYTVEMREDGGGRETVYIEAASDEDAISVAIEETETWISDGDYDTSGSTEWMHGSYTVTRAGETSEECSYCEHEAVAIDARGEPTCAECADGETVALGPIPAERVEINSDTVSVELAPTEPDCSHEDGHDWQDDEPGVWGHGGGVIIREVCAHCRATKTTDTWAQDRSTGEQGLRSVSYARSEE